MPEEATDGPAASHGPGRKPTLTLVIPCYNEEENVRQIYEAVRKVFGELDRYDCGFLFVDNASTDRTVEILRKICLSDSQVRVIVNSRNFGPVRSPFHGIVQSSADLTMIMSADFQDPPDLIPQFIQQWENGYKSVIGIKKQTEDSLLIGGIRRFYYRLVNRLSDMELFENFTGFGLYDRTVVDLVRTFDDPYPYFRGMISEIGSTVAKIEYDQPPRRGGVTKNRFYHLYDVAMLGITNHSKVPLRLATMLGFSLAMFCLLVALGYFVYKVVFWDRFDVGVGPLVIGLFFIGAVQLFFVGVIGEYVGSIHTTVMKRPLVVENERINFDPGSSSDAVKGDVRRK